MTEPNPLPAQTLADLLARFGDDTNVDAIPHVSLSAALAGGDDPWRVLAYLAGHGLVIAALPDLLAINADPDEDELGAHAIAEGIALSRASDGLWLVFVP